MTMDVREMMCAAMRAVMIVVVSERDVRAAILRVMTRISARAPKVPMRESCMISRARERSCAPLTPSKVSASPSSWNAPVMSAVTAVAMITARSVGSARLEMKNASAATVPMIAPIMG